MVNLVVLLNGCEVENDLIEIILSPYDALFAVDYEDRTIEYLENLGYNCNIISENTCQFTSIVTDGSYITFYNYSTNVFTRFDNVDGPYHSRRNTHTFDLKTGIASSQGLYTNKNLIDYNYYSAQFGYISQVYNHDYEYSEGFGILNTRSYVKDYYIDVMIKFAEKLVNEVYDISLSEFIETY
jgi:hypothetical protein